MGDVALQPKYYNFSDWLPRDAWPPCFTIRVRDRTELIPIRVEVDGLVAWEPNKQYNVNTGSELFMSAS